MAPQGGGRLGGWLPLLTFRTTIPPPHRHRLLMCRVPGGSAANVMKGLAGLQAAQQDSGDSDSGSSSSSCSRGGGRRVAVSFVGMVGADAVGAEYRRSIAAHGVQPLLLESASGAATATCLCLVTPDGQRTMRTALCAALELSSPEQLPRELMAPGVGGDDGTGGGAWALLHCEGYCLYRSRVAAAAMRAAAAAGAAVSLDLASFEVVARCWRQLDEELLGEGLVGTLFCNEQEAQAVCQVGG